MQITLHPVVLHVVNRSIFAVTSLFVYIQFFFNTSKKKQFSSNRVKIFVILVRPFHRNAKKNNAQSTVHSKTSFSS